MCSKKILKLIVVFAFFCVQTAFLFVLFRERMEYRMLTLTIVISLWLLLLVYRKLPLHHHEFSLEKFKVVVWIPIAAILTYYLNSELKLGAVFALGITGTLGSFLYLLNTRSDYLKQLSAPIYCGAFIGMSSIKSDHIYAMLFLAGIFTAILFSLTKSLFVGIGGKLGTLAFIGVVLSVLLFRLFIF